jgi:hypothetical protein
MKRWRLTVFQLGIALLFFAQSAEARTYTVANKPFSVMGYVSQTIQFGWKDSCDTQKGLQQVLTTAFLEGDYRPHNSLMFYVSGRFTIDWAYDILHDNREWNEKLFSHSRDNLYIDDAWWQFLQEAHMSWSPGPFFFRFGKQIVSWGEMDFLRIMDQINPIDQRRGFSDVEFESTIIPIPLVRAEFWPDINALGTFLDEIGLQFIFNMNPAFIPDQAPAPGNDVAGIWAADITQGDIRVGSLVVTNETPDAWDSDYFEYGLRLSGLIGSTIVTLNGFYGRANTPVTIADTSVIHPEFQRIADILGSLGLTEMAEMILAQGVGFHPSTEIAINPLTGAAEFGQVDCEGKGIVHPAVMQMFPRQKFIGATIATELPFLGFSAVGGAAPVVRSEIKYELDKKFDEATNTPVPTDDGFIESDMLDIAVGLDWKFKVNALNRKAYISTSTQLFYKHITDYPDYQNLAGAQSKIAAIPDANTFQISTLIQTAYFNAKLVPSVAFLWDIDNESVLLLPGISYAYSTRLSFSSQYVFFNGAIPGQGFDPFDNKDYISFNVKYTF